jgi:hypothetical protein
VTSATERRCKADTKRGRCRVTRGLNTEGLCAMHSGATDPRELGRKSGESRRKPNPERVHESLRTYLKREVPPERVWQALEAAMLGNNESARVSASRVLMDALAEPEQDSDEQRKADFARAGAEARQYLAEQLDRRARVLKAADVQQVRDVLEEVADEMRAAAVDQHPDLIGGYRIGSHVGDVSAEECERIFEGLEEAGLIVRAGRVEALAEEIAQERLRALREEHGVPA